MSTYLAVRAVSAHACWTGLWKLRDTETGQWKAFRKIKRAALEYPAERPLTRGYQTRKCSLLSSVIICLDYHIFG